MGGKDAPDPPDYRGAAEEQAEASREITNIQTWANRPRQVTPWGVTDWNTSRVIDPATGDPVTQWEQVTSLDPRLQSSLNDQFDLQAGRSDLAGELYNRVPGEFAGIVDFDQFSDRGGNVSANNYSDRRLSPVEMLRTRGLPELGGVGEQGVDRTLDYSGIADIGDPTRLRQRAEDSAYEEFTSRLDPQWEQRAADTETQLRNQGLRPGDQAYDRAMENLGRERNDAYAQARRGALDAGRAEADQLFNQDVTRRNVYTGEEDRQSQFYNSSGDTRFQQLMGIQGLNAGQRSQLFGERAQMSDFSQSERERSLSEMLRMGSANFDERMRASAQNTQNRQQEIAEEMQRRGFTLNEINAILTGQQVQMPTMPSFNTASKSETPQYLQAANMGFQAEMDAFNAEQAAQQAMMEGVGSIAGGFMMSDIRLKKNVKLVKQGPRFNTYTWDWNSLAVRLGVSWMPTRGVIAQEIQQVYPECVVFTDTGLLAVDYQLLWSIEEEIDGV